MKIPQAIARAREVCTAIEVPEERFAPYCCEIITVAPEKTGEETDKQIDNRTRRAANSSECHFADEFPYYYCINGIIQLLKKRSHENRKEKNQKLFVYATFGYGVFLL